MPRMNDRPFLLFTLYAPMASFGAIAVGDVREGWNRPARSAVLGLIGACLGASRTDQDAQAALAEEYGLGLLCRSPGVPLRDYHTAQRAETPRGQRFRMRAAELRQAGLNTVVTEREYRIGAWHTAALWVRKAQPRWMLDEIAQAMRRPAFQLYLGRKNCPLGLPLRPEILAAPSPETALMARDADAADAELRGHLRIQDSPSIIARDLFTADEAATPLSHRIEKRRDQPLSRTRWLFAQRPEIIISIGNAVPGKQDAAS